MAKPAPDDDKTRLDINDKDSKNLLHDFVYRDDMSLSEVAEYLETDWDNAYDWMKDQLKQAKDEE